MCFFSYDNVDPMNLVQVVCRSNFDFFLKKILSLNSLCIQRRCSNINCNSQYQKDIDNATIFTRGVYQVDAAKLWYVLTNER